MTMSVPTLRSGSSGQHVVDLQNDLNRALVPRPNLQPDGSFGPKTLAAVRAFQTQRRISVDGVVGPVTQCVLRGGPRSAPTIHNVRLIPQPTPSTCWAAATAMLKGSTVAAIIAATPPHLVLEGGGTANFSDSADNVTGNQEFARAHNLRYHAPQSWAVSGLKGLLQGSPVMVSMLWNAGEYVSGRGSSGHRMVIYGIDTDDDPTGLGTLLHIHDPWKPTFGKTFQKSYNALVNETPCFTYGVFTR
jgi:peptidoglycan hydrolase-like protein with peptidoglycan-binding domain